MNNNKELSKQDMLKYLNEINDRLKKDGKFGEIILTGGAALSLVFEARDSTRDIDAIFEPSQELREIIKDIAEQNDGLSDDWLNDGVKGFVTDKMEYDTYMTLSNLTVYNINAECLLAMKLTAHRVDTKDMDDSIFLMKILDIRNEQQLFDIVNKYTHENQHTPATKFFTQEAFGRYSQELAVPNASHTDKDDDTRSKDSKTSYKTNLKDIKAHHANRQKERRTNPPERKTRNKSNEELE